MRQGNAVISALLIFASAAAFSQPAPSNQKATAPDAAVVGVWRAEADGLPFITLTLTNEGGSLSGAILFYFHRREPGKPYTSTPGIPEPLLNPRFDGQTLTFQVSHRHAHPPRTLSDPPVSFRLKLSGKNATGLPQAELTNASESSAGFTIVRTDP